MASSVDSPAPTVARIPGPRWWRGLLAAAAAVYFGSIILGSWGSPIPDEVLPRPVRFFTQVACLFPHASRMGIDYRVEGRRCADGSWAELDPRPYFPIHTDDKESRFQRLGHFYRRERVVMEALEAYLVGQHNDAVARGPTDDGIDVPIGGIRFSSLRIPHPEPGTRIERYQRRPLDEIPQDWRKPWFWTPDSRFATQCPEGKP